MFAAAVFFCFSTTSSAARAVEPVSTRVTRRAVSRMADGMGSVPRGRSAGELILLDLQRLLERVICFVGLADAVLVVDRRLHLRHVPAFQPDQPDGEAAGLRRDPRRWDGEAVVIVPVERLLP